MPISPIRRLLGAALPAALVGLFSPAGPAAAEPVDLELVLAVDVSGSMDADERRVQRLGYVEAIAHPEVIEAIMSGYRGRIAVTYVEWAGPNSQVVTLPWRIIDGADTARKFADDLAAAPPAFIHGTSISGSLDFASKLFTDNGYEGRRRVIDVSGDGPNNSGAPVEPVRDRVVGQGIVINGLPIVIRPSYAGWSGGAGRLDAYYRDCVIGGLGAFVVPVHDIAQFAPAVRRKLILEIAGLAPPGRVITAGYRPGAAPLPIVRAAAKSDCLIGESLRHRWRDWRDEE